MPPKTFNISKKQALVRYNSHIQTLLAVHSTTITTTTTTTTIIKKASKQEMITITLRIIHQLVRGSISRPIVTRDKKVIIPFRCWPIDLDAFFHMNNANYLLNAELSRWRTLPASSVFSRVLSEKGMVFFAAENTVRYLRPILPMQKYVISTTCSVDDENKWFYYRHVFQQHPNDVPMGTLPKEYAIVDLKAVVKERSGKTIRPSELIQDSAFYRQWVTKRSID